MRKLSERTGVLHLREELRRTRETLGALYKCAPLAIVTLDIQGLVTQWNPAAEVIFGWTEAEVLGKPIPIIPVDKREEFEEIWRREIERREIVELELRRQRRDGTPIDIMLRSSALADSSGAVIGVLGVIADITARKEAEKALRESETRYRTVADNTYDFEFWLSPDGRPLYASPSFRRIYGRDPSEFVADAGLRRRSVHTEDRQIYDFHCDASEAQRLPGEIEFRIVRPDGTCRWIAHACQPVYDSEGRYLGVRGSSRDITERKQAEEELRRLNEDLESRVAKRTEELLLGNETLRREMAERQRLEAEIIGISEREQRRIGHDLHDGICQQLVGINYFTEAIAARLPPGLPEQEQLAKVSRDIRETILHTRMLSRGLAPIALENLDLESALSELASATKMLFQVSCEMEWREPFRARDTVVATHLYRITQEAIQNALKHGKATEILIRMEDAGSEATLTITNNGRAFPEATGAGSGMGLRIMRYRAEMIGGRLEVGSVQKGGTFVACTFKK